MAYGLYSDDIINDLLRVKRGNIPVQTTPEQALRFSQINQQSYGMPGPMLARAAQTNLDDQFIAQLQDRVLQREESSWGRLKNNMYRKIGISSDIGVPTLLLKGLTGGFLWAWENTVPRAARAGELLQQGKVKSLKDAWEEADVDDPLSRYITARKQNKAVDIGTGFLSVTSDPEKTKTYQQLLDEGVSPDIARAFALQQLGKPIFEEYFEEAATKVQFTGERAKALLERGVTPTVTPGRYLFKPFEFIASPQSEAYDFLTGVADLALSWYADPANKVLKGVSAVTARRSMFGLGKQKSFAALTTEQADSMGFLEKGLQKVARQKTVQQYLASDDMKPFLAWMYDNRNNPATIIEKSNFNLTRLSEFTGHGSKQFKNFYNNLEKLPKGLTDDTAKAEAVRRILNPKVLVAGTGGEVPRAAKSGLLRKSMKETFSQDLKRQFGQIYDNTQLDVNNADYLVQEYTKYLSLAQVDEVVKNERIRGILKGLDEVGDNQYARANFISSAIKNDLLRQRNFYIKELGGEAKLSESQRKFIDKATTVTAGYLEDHLEISRYYGSMNVSMPISFKPEFIKYHTQTLGYTQEVAESLFEASYRYPTFENHLITSISLPQPSAVVKVTRQMQDSLGSQVGKVMDYMGENALVNFMDSFYSKAFKPLALLRVAYLVRVQIEEQARLAASGINSLYKHPIQYIANLFAGTYNKADGWLPGSNQFKLGLSKAQINQGYTDRVLGRTGGKNFSRESWQLKGKEHPEFNNSVYADWIGTFDDPLARRIALIESSLTSNKSKAYATLVKELKTEGNQLRTTMLNISNNPSNPRKVLNGKGVKPAEYEQLLYDFIYTQRAQLHDLLGGSVIEKAAQGVRPVNEWVTNFADDELIKAFAIRKFTSKGGKEINLNLAFETGIDEITIKKWRQGALAKNVMKNISNQVAEQEANIKKLFLNKFDPKKILPDEYQAKVAPQLDPTLTKRWDKITNLGFKYLSELPANQLTRSPAFFNFYYKISKDLIAMSSEKVKQAIIKGAAKDGVSKKLLKEMKATPSAGGAGINDLEIINKLAVSKALDETRILLYDISKKGDFWETTRLIFPFGGAYQEIFQTWGRLTKQNLQFLTRPSQLSISGIKPNPVYDSESNKGFFYQNPSNGEIVFGYPGLEGLAQRWMFGADNDNVKVNLPVYAASINLAASVLPGVGPVVRLPATYLMDNYPEEGFVNRLIFGDFEPPDLSDPTEIAKAAGLYPAYLQKLSTLIFNKDENSVGAFGNTVIDTYRALVYAGIISDSEEDREDALRIATQQAKFIYLIRFASQYVGPAGVSSPLYELKVENGDYYFFQTLADEYRDIKTEKFGDDFLATQEFIQRYGVNPLALSVSKTTTVQKRPVTKEGAKFMEEYPELYEEYPITAFYINPEPFYGDLSWNALKKNYIEGDSVPRTPRQHAALQAKIKGFVEFTKWEEMMGLQNNNSLAARELKKEYQNMLMMRYWGYNQPTLGLPEKPTSKQQFAELEKLILDPRLESYDAVKALKNYMKKRQIIIDTVKAKTGSETVWKTSDDYVGVRNILREYGYYLAAQYPQFGPVYQNLLKSELQGEAEDIALTQQG